MQGMLDRGSSLELSVPELAQARSDCWPKGGLSRSAEIAIQPILTVAEEGPEVGLHWTNMEDKVPVGVRQLGRSHVTKSW